ncbi:MAG: HlyD family efflux transporter periplasmic adaptor subunit, partial [Planctomycetales bacterium]|nr:HlyD family efflux transporter periplasmic adaptor subunit [Planctomycetales bacterium]
MMRRCENAGTRPTVVSEPPTADMLDARWRLRRDAAPRVERFAGRDTYVLEDRRERRFYQLGEAEFTLLESLDGRRTLAEAIAITATNLGTSAFREEEAKSVIRWAWQRDLLMSADEDEAVVDEASNTASQIRDSNSGRRPTNLFFQRIPLRLPPSVLTSGTFLLGWLFSLGGFLTWLTVVATSVYLLANDWSAFLHDSGHVLLGDSWLWLGATWVGLKVFHEACHAVACKRLGGDVHQFGFAWLVFMPVAYVDVTSSWRMTSKWRRAAVAAAGMYGELLLAALAIWLRHLSHSPVVDRWTCQAILLASVSTLIFNANPLMRFDGYYILADLAEIPNLYSIAPRRLANFARRVLFGPSANDGAADPDESLARRAAILGYAISAWVWRIFVSASIMFALAFWLRGLGVLLAVFAAATWLLLPALRTTRSIAARLWVSPVQRWNFVVRGAVLFGVPGCVMMFAPWPLADRAPGYVEFSPPTYVRVQTAGFLREVLVSDGQQVEVGQVLARLENEPLAAEIVALEIDIAQTEIRARLRFQEEDLAAYQVELAKLDAFRERLAEKRDEAEKLTIRATAAGTLIAPRLQSRRDAFVPRGEELAVIGDPDRKEFRILVPQDDLEVFTDRVGQELTLIVNGREQPIETARLEQIRPRAVVQAEHPGLLASAGGPLAVIAATPQTNDEPLRTLARTWDGAAAAPRW